MKLILSRKGFDSANGGCPSPIFPGDAMFSLPIPHCGGERLTYGDLRCAQAENIGELVCNLTHDRIDAERSVHMSPDLNPPSGYPKLFDQVKAAKGHLKNQGVKEGDLFLFFGLYRKVKKPSNGQGWRFDPNAPRQHVLWGWLQVGAKHKPEKGDDRLQCSCGNSNTRYVASDHLDLGDGKRALGAGVFPRFDERLLLTDPDGTGVTQWRLPKSFHPDGKTPLTYHGKRKWTPKGDYTYVQRNGPGQEFVLNLCEYKDVKGWALDLIRDLDQP